MFSELYINVFCTDSKIKLIVAKVLKNNSKKHHFIPQCQLKYFASNSKRSKVFVFDKKDEKSYTSSIKNAGSENHFNTIKIQGKEVNFETLFDWFDMKLGIILKKISDEESLVNFNDEEIEELLLVVAIQYARVKIRRDSFSQMTSEINEFVFNTSKTMNATPHLMPQLSDEELKLVTIGHLLQIEKVIEILREKDLVLYKNIEPNCPFWISDNPITIYNPIPFGEHGFASRGTELFFPLTYKLTLGLVCTSTKNTLQKKVEYLNPLLEKRLHCLKSRGTLDAMKSAVNFLNYLQITNSSRFLYSPNNEFNEAENILKNNPNLKEIKTKVTLQKGISSYPRMGKGEILAVIGKITQCMIPIKLIKSEAEFEFLINPRNLITLNETIEDGDIIEAKYFVDKSLRRSMKDMIIKESNSISGRIILTHKNEVINSLFKDYLAMKNKNKSD